MKKSRKRSIYIILFMCAMLVLALTILFCRRRISRELEKQVQETLSDVAAQNVIGLESVIEDKQKLLETMVEQCKAEDWENPEESLKLFKPLVDIYQFKRIGFVRPDGSAYTTDGHRGDLSFREFFKKGMEGQFFISGVIMDSIGTEEKINVFSMPVFNQMKTEIQGVFFITFRTSMFQNMISVDSFGGKGYSYVVQSNGTVITRSSHSAMRVQNNMLSFLEDADPENEAVVEKMRDEMRRGRSGYTSFKLDGDNYVYYMPIRYSFDAKPCYLLTVVPSEVVSGRLTPVLRYMNIMLASIWIVLGIAAFFFIYTYRKGRVKLVKLAYEDPLTGGDNYACFEVKLKEKQGTPGYLITMDLSEFKIINNTCGVEMGDETLRSVWFILRKNIRHSELAARINADRFVLFLADESQEELTARLGQISGAISHLSKELNIPRLSAYFGIYPMNGKESMEVAYGRANEAKHLVKGRRDTNYAFYDESGFQQVMDEKNLEDRFEGAIAKREFEVWYQPKYSADSACIVGAEALVRWRDSDGSLIPPYKFIPLFEKNGMISILDEYVFKTVCRQQKRWEHEGMPMLPVSINISRSSLYYEDIVDRYRSIIEEFNVEARFVPLEITESATIDNMEIRGLIDQFHAAGFPLLLDDFGNGYSSLATLNIMPFDILKLDKSLIDYIGDEKGEKLLYHVIKLAKSLGMQITAEGVEYREQVEFLQQLQCNDIQGFYFSRPLPLEDYQKKMEIV